MTTRQSTSPAAQRLDRGTCTGCGEPKAMRKDYTVLDHRAPSTTSTRRAAHQCPGANKRPAELTPAFADDIRTLVTEVLTDHFPGQDAARTAAIEALMRRLYPRLREIEATHIPLVETSIAAAELLFHEHDLTSAQQSWLSENIHATAEEQAARYPHLAPRRPR